AAAVAQLAAVCRVTGWRDPGVLRSQFHALAQVAAGVPVVEAVIPWGQAAGPTPWVPGLLDLVGQRR
ncbi:MAG: hypothetical protein M3326_16295, partial [Actinomycetota bacterium]|nr:hypothetical protein [Actinomycetota bacterium]